MDEHKLNRLRQLLEAGHSCREAAAELGVSAATAIRWTRRAGLVSRRSRRLNPEVRAGLKRALGEGLMPDAAAAKFGVHPRTAALMLDPQELALRRGAARARALEALQAGRSLAEAAEAAGVGLSTAGRWARQAGLPGAALRRRALSADEAKALAAMEGGMSAGAAAETFALDATTMARLLRRGRLAPERLERRRRLFAALASGLSCRKAAAEIGLPVATAIRWAREGGKTRHKKK